MYESSSHRGPLEQDKVTMDLESSRHNAQEARLAGRHPSAEDGRKEVSSLENLGEIHFEWSFESGKYMVKIIMS